MPNQTIEQLTIELEDLKKKVERLLTHKHLGNDGSSLFDGSTDFIGKSLVLGGGVSQAGKVFAPVNIVDSTVNDALTPDRSPRSANLAIWVSDKYTTAEQDNFLFSVSKIDPDSNSIPVDNIDWVNNWNETRIRVAQNPFTTAGFSGPSVIGPLGFLIGEKSPLIQSVGTLSAGGSTMVDSDAKFPVDGLVGSVITIYDSSKNIICSYRVTSNTANTVSMGDYNSAGTVVAASFPDLSGSYSYNISGGLLLGSAEIPFDRLYVGQDIRMGYGSSGGDQVIYIKWGNGSPEGVVTANIGSIYLRKDGGAGTVLYVKEANNGAATGWSTTA